MCVLKMVDEIRNVWYFLLSDMMYEKPKEVILSCSG